MQLLVIHLSDCHFSRKKTLGPEQLTALVAAAQSKCHMPDMIYVVLSGDIAATGSKEDYEVANSFLSALKEHFEKIISASNIRILTVPGNHDFDDNILKEAGDTLASEILRNEREPSDSKSTYDLLLQEQGEYWLFDAKWSAQPSSSLEDKIFRRVPIQIEGTNYNFDLFNTAILSRRHETQGKLWFPINAAASLLPKEPNGNSYTFSIFHHPYVWLESNNAVRFRQLIELHSDFALNGHQHTPESYFASSLGSTQTWYSAGDALIGKTIDDSGFATLVINTEDKSRNLAHFKWNGSLYIESFTTGDHALPSMSSRRGIALTEEFAAELEDPETLIVHSQKRNVLLQDIFEPPRLRGGANKTLKSTRRTTTTNIKEILKENEAVYIFGDTLSGKTCLGKDIFRQLFERDGSCIPILLSGRDLISSKTHDIDRWCNRAVRHQFRGISPKDYEVTPRERKVAIIDDWHSLAFNENSKRIVMKELCARHKHTILLCDSWYQAKELASVLDSNDPLLPKTSFTILPLTPTQRASMIRRWLALGQSEDISDDDSVYQFDAAEKYLNELHRSGLMPPYPLYILTALQTLQAMQTEPDLGAQGVLFDLLIGNKLAAMSADAPELDINRQFIAYLAHDIFEREGKGISEDRTSQLSAEFLERFAVAIKLEPLLQKLVEHKVLTRSDGMIAFRHRYMYYYFVAEHLVSAMQKKATRVITMDKLMEMTKYVTYEEYAQILMFVIYKTRSEELIEALVINSKKIFENVESSTLEHDVLFVNRLDITRTPLSLSSKSVEENRDARRRELPEESAEYESVQEESDQALTKVSYSDELEWGAKIQFAFKTTMMLGRVLRNFPGTLEAKQKKNLAENSLGTSLRMLRSIFKEAEKEKEDIISLLKSATDESETLTETEKIQIADARLVTIMTMCGYAVVRFLTQAVGSPKLELTLNEIREETPDVPSMQLIDLAIRLDNFKGIPLERIQSLADKLSDNFLAYQVLRLIVWHRLTYLPLEDRNLRASLSDKFELKASSTPILLANLPSSRK